MTAPLSPARERLMAIEDLIAADRRLHPDLWTKIDRIAEIIDPSAFSEAWWDGTASHASLIRVDNARVRYQRSAARNKAMSILRYLGLTPVETDWAELFAEAERSCSMRDGQYPDEDPDDD